MLLSTLNSGPTQSRALVVQQARRLSPPPSHTPTPGASVRLVLVIFQSSIILLRYPLLSSRTLIWRPHLPLHRLTPGASAPLVPMCLSIMALLPTMTGNPHCAAAGTSHPMTSSVPDLLLSHLLPRIVIPKPRHFILHPSAPGGSYEYQVLLTHSNQTPLPVLLPFNLAMWQLHPLPLR
jgi:hypothetical protein